MLKKLYEKLDQYENAVEMRNQITQIQKYIKREMESKSVDFRVHYYTNEDNSSRIDLPIVIFEKFISELQKLNDDRLTALAEELEKAENTL